MGAGATLASALIQIILRCDLVAILWWLERTSPLITCAGVLLIIRKMKWRWHPALWGFLLTQSLIESMTAAKWMTRDYSIPIQVLTIGALLAERGKFSRINLTRRAQAGIAGLLLALCVLHAALQPWTLDYKLSLFRSDFRIVAALVANAILAYRWRYPMLETHAECHRNRVCRIGVAAWLTVSALSGLTVKGWLGMWLLKFGPVCFREITAASYLTLMVTVIALAAALNQSAPGRKRGAKRPDGKTVTGAIEMRAQHAA